MSEEPEPVEPITIKIRDQVSPKLTFAPPVQ
jgi:hypothetical protein